MKEGLLTITTATEDTSEKSAQAQTVDQQATWLRVISPIVTSLDTISLRSDLITSGLKFILKRNVETVHRGEWNPHSSHCDYKSGEKGYLKTHIKTVHRGERNHLAYRPILTVSTSSASFDLGRSWICAQEVEKWSACSVASPAVIVQADTGVAVPVAHSTSEVGALRAVHWLSFRRALLSLAACLRLASDTASPLRIFILHLSWSVAISSHLLTSMSIDPRSRLHASLKRSWASMSSLVCDQFAVQQILWHPSLWREVDMFKPAECALLKTGEQAWDSSLDEDGSIRQAVTSLDADDAPQVSQVERI